MYYIYCITKIKMKTKQNLTTNKSDSAKVQYTIRPHNNNFGYRFSHQPTCSAETKGYSDGWMELQLNKE